MGLDMYLEARRHLPPSDLALAPVRAAIGQAVGYIPPRKKPGDDPTLLEVAGVTVRVGYWHRHFRLHGWFVIHAMAGKDDDRAAYVSPEALNALEDGLDEEDGSLVEDDIAYTRKVLAEARKLQERGWDLYYRACS